MNMPSYHIEYILRVSTERFKDIKTDNSKSKDFTNMLDGDLILSFDGKNKLFANQLIIESIALLTTGCEQKDSQIAEDIPDELISDDRRRRLYGTPS
jgi:hypothetical protein